MAEGCRAGSGGERRRRPLPRHSLARVKRPAHAHAPAGDLGWTRGKARQRHLRRGRAARTRRRRWSRRRRGCGTRRPPRRGEQAACAQGPPLSGPAGTSRSRRRARPSSAAGPRAAQPLRHAVPRSGTPKCQASGEQQAATKSKARLERPRGKPSASNRAMSVRGRARGMCHACHVGRTCHLQGRGTLISEVPGQRGHERFPRRQEGGAHGVILLQKRHQERVLGRLRLQPQRAQLPVAARLQRAGMQDSKTASCLTRQ